MAKPTGFLDYARKNPPKRKVKDRVKDFREIEQRLGQAELEIQAARCMDCGVPSCHAYGCPLSNLIPDWNDMIYKKQWRKALDLLHATNNFPEFTGRVCPAPCEPACTLAINQDPVTIRQIELQIVERGWEQGWIQPQKPEKKTGKKVAIVGSGPAGMAAAQQLARAGHAVTLFEKADRIGGYLRYGIPDYKLEKSVIDRRMAQMRDEGVVFKAGTNAGKTIKADTLKKNFDAILITIGAGEPRDLPVSGRNLKGVHFALEFLTQQNKRTAGDKISVKQMIHAKGKHVVVVGGGDTGADCIGTSIRQGAKKVIQLELLSQPPKNSNPATPWPAWPVIHRIATSHEEGCDRMWDIQTKSLEGDKGQLKVLKAAKLKWTFPENNRPACEEISGSGFDLKADLVFLAMGFIHPEHGALVKDLKVKLDGRGNIAVDDILMTSQKGVFAAGDAETGASLVVRAINRGRLAAAGVDAYLSKLRKPVKKLKTKK
ncbi:glutamate synthase subunit beta [bacterium]|nr:glutamate synthase subunit beta [bacterium]